MVGAAIWVGYGVLMQAAPIIVRLPGHVVPLATGSRVALRPDLARSRLFDSAGEAFALSA